MSTSQVIGARNEMMMDDYDGQMIFGDLVGLKLPDIRLTGEEKTPKKPHPGNLSRPGIEPGPAENEVGSTTCYLGRINKFWCSLQGFDLGSPRYTLHLSNLIHSQYSTRFTK